MNNFVANLWNNKNVKKILDEIEWSFRVVRGNLTRQEKDSRIKATGSKVDLKDNEDSDEEKKTIVKMNTNLWIWKMLMTSLQFMTR